MTSLVVTILVFLAVGSVFLAANLMAGWFVRPNRPNAAKGEIYECGEKPEGNAWIQFDLRFYVVALLFVIFDVELAFFFPWAVVFGSSMRMADETLSTESRLASARELTGVATESLPSVDAMHSFAWLSFGDMLVFFSILLVGFAYLWKRGDLEWVRSTAGQPT
jgi:NADH-quinone oxidoreductase subunit A